MCDYWLLLNATQEAVKHVLDGTDREENKKKAEEPENCDPKSRWIINPYSNLIEKLQVQYNIQHWPFLSTIKLKMGDEG